MLNFAFLKKGLGLVSRSYFVQKILGYITLTDQISLCLPLLLEISDNMCIVTVCIPDCEATSLEIYLSFLIKPFFYITKKSEQKIKYSKNEKNFKGEIKACFIIFKGFSVARCIRPDSAFLKNYSHIVSKVQGVFLF